MADLSLLQTDPLTAARLTDALQIAHEVRVCTTWTALGRELEAGDVDVCVVDADHPSRRKAVRRLADLQRRHPTTAMVAFGDFQGQQQTVYDLGRLGVDGVVTAQRGTDPLHVREAVDRALLSARARQAGRLTADRVDAPGVRAVAWAVEHARERPEVDTFAEALGTTPSGLATLLRVRGLPSPSRLLIWGRLLLAGALLARDGQTVEATAYRVGYAGASGLTRAMKREADRTPGEIARGGGLEEVHRRLFSPGRHGPGRSRLRLLGLAGLAVFLPACASHGKAPATGSVPETTPEAAVERLVAQPPMDGLHLGVLAVEAGSGRTIVARSADRRFIPASNQKILTTAAALHLLGPDHRWRTGLWSAAPLRGGTLEGDLHLVGTGDPTLSERWWPSARAALDALADSLRRAGVDRVAGRLVVDVSAWDTVSVPGSWEAGDLPYRYAATGGAFAVGEGELHAVVRGGDGPGRPALLEEWWPAADSTFLRADLRTVDADSSLQVRGHHLPETGAVVLRGEVPVGTVDTVRMAVREPVRQAAALLDRALGEAGIVVEEGTVVRWTREEPAAGHAATCRAGTALPDCPGARLLASLASPPLSEVVQAILEPSQNWLAEQLLRTVGAARIAGDEARSADGEAASRDTRQAGREAITAYLTGTVGLDSLAAVPEDGSGMAPRNLVTPAALVAVLDHLRRSGHGPLFREALASPGEEDSTLEDRLLDLEGRLFAKTGSISNVDALSGYLVRSDGTELIFSILSNGSGLSHARVRTVLDDVVRMLAEG